MSSDGTWLVPKSDRNLHITSGLCKGEMYCYLCNHWHPREEESKVQRMEYSREFLDINFDLNSGLFYALVIILLTIYLRISQVHFQGSEWLMVFRLSIDKVIQFDCTNNTSKTIDN